MVAADAVSGAVSSQRIGPGIQPHHLLGSRRGVVRNGTALQTFSKSLGIFPDVVQNSASVSPCSAPERFRKQFRTPGGPCEMVLYGLFSRLVLTDVRIVLHRFPPSPNIVQIITYI